MFTWLGELLPLLALATPGRRPTDSATASTLSEVSMRIRFTTFLSLNRIGLPKADCGPVCTHCPRGRQAAYPAQPGPNSTPADTFGQPFSSSFPPQCSVSAGKSQTVRIYVAEIASVCISYYFRAIAVEYLISVCFSIFTVTEVHITAFPEAWWGAHACDHIAGSWNNRGAYPGMRARAPVRGAARRAARERRTAVAPAPQEPGRTACRSGSARPAARSPETSPRTTG